MSLHLATTLRVIASHLNTRFVKVEYARNEVCRLAMANAGHSTLFDRDKRLIEKLEQRTGISIAELAELATEWT